MVFALLAVAGLSVLLFARNKSATTQPASSPIQSTPDRLPPETGQEAPDQEVSDIEATLASICVPEAERITDESVTPQAGMPPMQYFEETLAGVKDRLLVSTNAEHLHLAALIERDPVARVEHIERAVAQNSTDPFLMWHAVRYCFEAAARSNCPLSEWEDKLLEIDGQNSEAWIRIATNRYLEGNEQEAYRALQRAATAAVTRAYWTETVEMIERGLSAGSDLAFPDRAGMAFGVAATRLPDYSTYLDMCKEQAATNVDWAYACLAYGELVERQGKTEMGQAFALHYQGVALEALGEDEGLREVISRQDARKLQRLDAFDRSNDLTERLMVTNSTLFAAYLANVRTHGELVAQARMRNEVRQWLSRRDNSTCVTR
jgi:hypothetical protein